MVTRRKDKDHTRIINKKKQKEQAFISLFSQYTSFYKICKYVIVKSFPQVTFLKDETNIYSDSKVLQPKNFLTFKLLMHGH